MDDKRFWTLLGVLILAVAANATVAYESISQNRQRISALESERYEDQTYIREMLVRIESSSRETSEKVVDALTGLTTVISDRASNDGKILNLLEAIYKALHGETNGE